MHKDSILLTDEKLTEKLYKVSKTSDCNLRMDWKILPSSNCTVLK